MALKIKKKKSVKLETEIVQLFFFLRSLFSNQKKL